MTASDTETVLSAAGDERFAPAKVIVADVERGIGDLDDLLDGAAGYAFAWVVLRLGACPQALIEVALSDPASREVLQHKLIELSEATSIGGAAVTPAAVLPAISVIVPTMAARVDGLTALLRALAGQDYQRFEVVLVDNRGVRPANDPLPELISGDQRVRIVHQPVPGISAARNAGVASATGEIVVFTDDDVLPAPGWLTAIGRRFASGSEDAVTGLVLPGELETPAQMMFERYYGGFSGARTFRPARYSRRGASPARRGGRRFSGLAATSPLIDVQDGAGAHTGTLALYQAGAIGAGCNMAFRRSVLVAHPFDEALGTGTATRGGEDLAALIGVLWRGGEIGFEPAATVQHVHRRDYDALVDQMSGYGIGYSAAFTALMAQDPRYLVSFARLLPSAARQFASVAAQRLRGRAVYDADGIAGTGADAPGGSLFPPELARRELAGYVRGPGAYLRSRRQARRGGDR